MGLGYTEIAPAQDVSFTAQAQMVAEVLDALGIERSIWSPMTAAARSRRFSRPITRTGCDRWC